jgi:hypothetical protein
MKRKIVNGVMLVIGIVIAFNLFFMTKYHHKRAADRDGLLSEFNLALPSVAEAESYDNYDRGSSRWDCHEYFITFQGDYSDQTISEFERLCSTSKHWTKEFDSNQNLIYTYRSEPEWESDTYFYKCSFEKGKCQIEYYIDEDEAIFNVLIYGALLFLWLILYIIILFWLSYKR